jgi:hypothetical protein
MAGDDPSVEKGEEEWLISRHVKARIFKELRGRFTPALKCAGTAI